MVGDMTFENLGLPALDYFPCRYGASKMLFRGPKRRLDKPYVAFLGGTETYGKFIGKPFANLVEEQVGRVCVNLGAINAGVDVYLNDPSLLEIAAGARACVVQVMGAQNMSNRFYAVHPRRNDRFLQASELMRTVFRDVDFTRFNFTRHLLRDLRNQSEERFEMVRFELKQAWLARMDQLLAKIPGPVVLVWFADHAIGSHVDDGSLGHDPLFVDREMIEALRPKVGAVVEVAASQAALAEGTFGMVYTPMEAPAAAELMGPLAHEEAAQAVSTALIETMPML